MNLMGFKKNKFVKYFVTLVILASCSSTSRNLASNSNQPKNSNINNTFESLKEYQSFFINDLNLIQEAIQEGDFDQKKLNNAKLLKRNYERVLSRSSYSIQLNSEQQYSKEIIDLSFHLNLPIKISWVNQGKRNLPANLLLSKINGFCSSIYEDSLKSIFNVIQDPESTIIIYSPQYKFLLKMFESSIIDKKAIELNSFAFQEFVSEILGVDESNNRFKKISSLNPNQNLKFSPRSRSDFTHIILMVNPESYKAIVPSLRYHGENKFIYLNFISSLEDLNSPLQLLDYEDSLIQLSKTAIGLIQDKSMSSLENFLERSILRDWLLTEVLRQAGVQSASINGMTGQLFFNAGKCTQREMPISKMKAKLLST